MKNQGKPIWVHLLGAGIVLIYAIWSFAMYRDMSVLALLSYVVGPSWMLWAIIRSARD